MAEMLPPPLLIANPAAGPQNRDVLARLQRALTANRCDHNVVLTEARGHATALAREAVNAGHRYVVVVGGDGTLHETLNGLIDPTTGVPHAADLVVGIVGGGSGSDFARTFGLDRSPEHLAHHLLGDTTMRIDLGRARVTTGTGETSHHIFANIANVGFGATVAALSRRLPRRLGPGRYLPALALAWLRFRREMMTLQLSETERTEHACNVVVANGQFMGGGMHVAPRAIPHDGVFSVQSWGGSAIDLLRAPRQLRTGAHLQRDDVRSWTVDNVGVTAARAVPVEADGEPLGVTPAEFSILKQVIHLKI